MNSYLSVHARQGAQENLVKFIEHYNGLQVRIEASSVKCDIVDTDLYIKKVGEGLQAIGITPRSSSPVRAPVSC